MNTLMNITRHIFSNYQNLLQPVLTSLFTILLLILPKLPAHTQTSCWEGTLENDVSYPLTYCEPVTFTYTIKNTCSSAASFDVNIQFEESQYEILSLEDMPGAVYDADDPTSTITWETPVLSVDESFEFDLQFIVTASSSGGALTVYYRVKREEASSFYLLTVNPYAIPLKYVDGPESASQLIQDFWDYGILTILPLENIGPPGAVKEACDPTSTQTLFVSGGIDFDLGTETEPVEYCLHNETEESIIRLGEGAFLRVSAYTTLVVTDMEITGCQHMWRGFYVEKNAKLVLRNCTIRDAHFAIETERGATVECLGNTFENNFVGIYVAPMPTEPIGNPPVYEPEPFEDAESSYINMIRFYGNVFRGTGFMLEPYEDQEPEQGDRPFAGVWVTDLSSFRIPSVETPETVVNNSFEGMTNGFVADRVSFIVDKAQFIDITADAGSDYQIEGYGIYSENQLTGRVFGFGGAEESYPSFDNCDVGIFSEAGSLYIKDNAMHDVGYGIICKRGLMRPTDIVDNYITASMRGINVSHGAPLTSGTIEGNHIIASGDQNETACIVLSHLPIADKWQITNNILKLGDGYAALWLMSGEETVVRNNSIFLLSSVIEDRYGIHVNGTKDVEIGCNHIIGDVAQMNYKLNRGIYLGGAPGAGISCNSLETCRFGLNASGMSDGSIVRGNEIGTNWDGLLLGLYPDYGNTVIGDQVHQGNLWTSTYAHYGAVHHGTFEEIVLSEFYVDELANSEYNTTVLSEEDWFFDEDDGGKTFECDEPVEQCPEGIGYQGLDPEWTELDTLLATGNLGFETFDTSLSWTGRLHVYRRIKAWESDLTLPEVLDDFLDDNTSTNIGLLSNVFDSLNAAFIPSSARGENMHDWIEDLSEHFDSIWILDTLLYHDPDDSELLAALADELESIYDITEEYGDTLKEVMASALSVVGNAKVLLNTISSGRSWETDLRDALKQVTYYLDESQSPNVSLLTALAESCPDAQGDGVFIARSRMDELDFGVGYDDYDICSTAEPRSAWNPVFNSRLLLRPNPASQFVTIEASSWMRFVSVYDLSGRCILRTETTGTIYELLIEQFSTGLYVIEVEFSDGSTSSNKLLIERVR